MHISVQNLTYVYEGSYEPALDGLTANFTHGWTGVVGDNGSGKSTLLSLLCSSIRPTKGSISPDLEGVYCAQSTENPPENIEDFASDYSKEAFRLRALLSIDEEWFWRFDTLSHGERKRIQIACALFSQPSVLALDEPTNHLDKEARSILIGALQEYKGIGFLVSHDRGFLDQLCYQCLFMEKGQGILVPGSYSQGKAELDSNLKTAVAERENMKNEVRRLQNEKHRRQQRADQTASRRSGKSLAKHDNDGRAKLRLAVISGQDGKAGALSTQMDTKMKQAGKRLEETYVKKRYDKPLELVTEPAKRKILLKKEEGSISLGETKELFFPDLYVENTQRIGLRGSNGTGKSTLLKILLAEDISGIRILYIPQEMTKEQTREILLQVKALPKNELGRVLSIVARLNSPPSRILSGDELSPGELRKLMLACGLIEAPHLIVMDEPTNHLDIHSIEALQDVLASCECALMLVSHDALFLDALIDTSWSFQEKDNNSDEILLTTEAL